MLRTSRSKPVRLFALLLAEAILLTLLSTHVQAKNLHKDQATFEKNYELSAAQKKYTITEIERVVSKIIDPEMSDLEKYYTLALWENKHAIFDVNFWSGDYDMSQYRHQWDSYGVLTEKSVCVGVAALYANLCHAADLPCRVIRAKPWDGGQHTINYIPNINDNAYYVDVTENLFLMSRDTSFGQNNDTEFAHEEKPCIDHTFEFKDSPDSEIYTPTDLKACWRENISYNEWFREYALHQDTKNNFETEYVEKGSGIRGTHYASYKDYDSQIGDHAPKKPDIWFLEDFYRDPEAIKEKIRNKEFDEQLLDIIRVTDVYDCDSVLGLQGAIETDAIIRYFPSMENDEVLTWQNDFRLDKEYEVVCDPAYFDKSKGEAVVEFKGIGDYKGSCRIKVKITANNPMTLKAGKAKIKFSAVKKKAQIIKRSKVITVNKAKGTVTYQYVNAAKGSKSFKKYFQIDSKTGNITVKKGLKKGTYKVKVKVKAAGNDYYDASAAKTVTIKIQVV